MKMMKNWKQKNTHRMVEFVLIKRVLLFSQVNNHFMYLSTEYDSNGQIFRKSRECSCASRFYFCGCLLFLAIL